MPERIAIVGAGAVGGYVGGHLIHLGHDVVLIDPWPEHVEAMRTHGLELYGLSEDERCTVKARAMHLTEVQSLAGQAPIDIAFVAVKSYDTDWATMLIRQYLAPGGYVVSLQNCINEERIAAVVGWGRTVGMIAARLAVDLYEPGHIRRTVPKGGSAHAVFRLGEVHGRITRRVEHLGAMIGAIDSVKVTPNLWGERWSKLCVNGMRNGVAAATGLSGNDVDRIDAIRRFSIRLGGEAVRIGQALGYALEPIGELDPEDLARAGEGDRRALEEVEARILAVSNAGARSDLQRPSMGQDVLKGRRTEIEFMNGFIVEKGREIGRPAPAHAALVDVVKRVERGEMPPQPENVVNAAAGLRR
jgi:2-dehydropantoate 2-reductase